MTLRPLVAVVRRAAFGRPYGLLSCRGRPNALRSATNDDEDDSTNSDPYFPTGTLVSGKRVARPDRTKMAGHRVGRIPLRIVLRRRKAAFGMPQGAEALIFRLGLRA